MIVKISEWSTKCYWKTVIPKIESGTLNTYNLGKHFIIFHMFGLKESKVNEKNIRFLLILLNLL